ncbi:hypothetical protein BEL05_12210 [Shewanella colwelliana]|uniref:Knr4/Smi1-like domain-containing protein n=1 Tax=Shewanella colwelliana TaxID=23 RepID=A0A1E5IYL0_SHECO|nr:SMI1/KNR4 family protein [Shewanella colwelliana]OEG74933.1 hypothetical protein BEL05_12210 [Shewanella colwelliana]
MDMVNEMIAQMSSYWSTPKVAIHRGAEIPFKLRCSFFDGVEEYRLSGITANLPLEAKEFYLATDGATLFKDDKYGQWGLKIYCLDEIADATNRYQSERISDALEGDLIIGEFVGDSDYLLLRCNLKSADFGSVVIVSAIDSRIDWDVVAADLGIFLRKFNSFQGDKYWEIT